MTMITFARENTRFTYRIVGVTIEDGRVLLHQAEGDDFWALPGGRAELLEPAEATLRREMREELDIEVEVVRPRRRLTRSAPHLAARRSRRYVGRKKRRLGASQTPQVFWPVVTASVVVVSLTAEAVTTNRATAGASSC